MEFLNVIEKYLPARDKVRVMCLSEKYYNHGFKFDCEVNYEIVRDLPYFHNFRNIKNYNSSLNKLGGVVKLVFVYNAFIMNYGKFPETLRVLRFSNFFNESLNHFIFPPNLITLELPPSYSKQIKNEYLPPNLKRIVFYKGIPTGQLIIINNNLGSVEELIINNMNVRVIKLPETIKKFELHGCKKN